MMAVIFVWAMNTRVSNAWLLLEGGDGAVGTFPASDIEGEKGGEGGWCEPPPMTMPRMGHADNFRGQPTQSR